MRIKTLTLQVNRKCNLQCKHCLFADSISNSSEDVGTDADFIKLKRAIFILYKNGLEYVLISLTEPLLYPHIYSLIKFCSSLNIRVEIITNGMLLSKINITKLLENGLFALNISLEGITAKSNNFIRGINTFEKIIDSINILNNIKKELGLNTLLRVRLTLSTVNVSDAEEMPKYFNDLNIDELIINNISLEGAALNNTYLKLTEDEYFSQIKKLLYNYHNLDSKKFLLSVFSIMPMESIYLNLICSGNNVVHLPKCSAMVSSFSMDTKTILYSCNKNLLYLTAKSDKVFVPHIKIDTVTNLCSFDKSNVNFIDSIATYKSKYQKNTCSECSYYSICTLCPFADYTTYTEKLKRCNFFKNKLQKLILFYLNRADYYSISIKETAYIKIESNKLQTCNCYLNQNAFQYSVFLTTEEYQLLIFILNNPNIHLAMVIKKSKEANVDLAEFLFKIIITDCFQINDKKGK